MKIKHLIIVSLILTIIAVGVVSASEDDIVDNELAINDITEDTTNKVPIGEIIEESDDSQHALELDPNDFNAHIRDNVDLEDENNNVVINYTAPEGADGKVDVFVDDIEPPIYSKDIVPGQTVNVTTHNLNIVAPDNYNIKLVYVPNSGEGFTIAQQTLKAHIYTEKDFNIWYDKYIDSKNSNVVNYFSYPVEGTLVISVNGTPRCTKNIKELNEQIHVYLSDLNITADGLYNISAKYIIAATSKEIGLGHDDVEVKVFDWDSDEYVSIDTYVDILDHDDYLIEIDNNGNYVNGTVYVYVDDILKLTKNISSADEKIYFVITVDDLKLYDNISLGNHTIKVLYLKDNNEKHEVEEIVEFYALPLYYPLYIISVGEKGFFAVTYTKDFVGTATFYYAVDESYAEKGSVFKSANFVNGIASIPLDSLSLGEHYFILNITDHNVEYHIDVLVRQNTPGILASVSASEIIVGNNVLVKFSGPKSDEQVYISLDDKLFMSLPLTNGTLSETISDLSIGTHRINVYFQDGSDFYSNTFFVTVKPVVKPVPAPVKKDVVKLTLKKVKVKRSAKKLVLQATLKINGNNVKGKVIKFKFNKKTYKAKTNKKGVAKVTIKKKLLKKLKVGKKVKYQATYGKVTKSFTVKVKK